MSKKDWDEWPKSKKIEGGKVKMLVDEDGEVIDGSIDYYKKHMKNEVFKKHHVNFILEDEGKLHLEKFGESINKFGKDSDEYRNGVDYAINEALPELHEAGIYHNDIINGTLHIKKEDDEEEEKVVVAPTLYINSGNIVMKESGEYKLIDFGPDAQDDFEYGGWWGEKFKKGNWDYAKSSTIDALSGHQALLEKEKALLRQYIKEKKSGVDPHQFKLRYRPKRKRKPQDPIKTGVRAGIPFPEFSPPKVGKISPGSSPGSSPVSENLDPNKENSGFTGRRINFDNMGGKKKRRRTKKKRRRKRKSTKKKRKRKRKRTKKKRRRRR